MKEIINLLTLDQFSAEKKIQFGILASVFILQYFFEHVFPENRKYNSFKNEIRNLFIGVLNGLMMLIPAALLIQVFIYTDAHQVGLFHLIAIPFYLEVALTIIIMDLAMYAWHRVNHVLPVLWMFHRFHHLDKKMNTSTALRFHFVELLLSNIWKAGFFLLMGFNFLPVLIYEILFFIVVIIHHSNINISKSFDLQYRKLFSSPLMHRIHHSQIKEETDTNYGSVFSFWDRIFRTYKKEVAGPIIFGVKDQEQK
jgi:sterol desaturase/sphingolipid hydroxylase (fatty acid hydroxylase superfamily)